MSFLPRPRIASPNGGELLAARDIRFSDLVAAGGTGYRVESIPSCKTIFYDAAPGAPSIELFFGGSAGQFRRPGDQDNQNEPFLSSAGYQAVTLNPGGAVVVATPLTQCWVRISPLNTRVFNIGAALRLPTWDGSSPKQPDSMGSLIGGKGSIRLLFGNGVFYAPGSDRTPSTILVPALATQAAPTLARCELRTLSGTVEIVPPDEVTVSGCVGAYRRATLYLAVRDEDSGLSSLPIVTLGNRFTTNPAAICAWSFCLGALTADADCLVDCGAPWDTFGDQYSRGLGSGLQTFGNILVTAPTDAVELLGWWRFDQGEPKPRTVIYSAAFVQLNQSDSTELAVPVSTVGARATLTGMVAVNASAINVRCFPKLSLTGANANGLPNYRPPGGALTSGDFSCGADGAVLAQWDCAGEFSIAVATGAGQTASLNLTSG